MAYYLGYGRNAWHATSRFNPYFFVKPLDETFAMFAGTARQIARDADVEHAAFSIGDDMDAASHAEHESKTWMARTSVQP